MPSKSTGGREKNDVLKTFFSGQKKGLTNVKKERLFWRLNGKRIDVFRTFRFDVFYWRVKNVAKTFLENVGVYMLHGVVFSTTFQEFLVLAKLKILSNLVKRFRF